MSLTILTHRRADAAIAIEPAGPIVSENAHQLRDRVTAVLAATKPETIVVDLSSVPTMDETGADTLASSRDAAAEREATLLVADPAPDVYDQLRQYGVADLLSHSAPDHSAPARRAEGA